MSTCVSIQLVAYDAHFIVTVFFGLSPHTIKHKYALSEVKSGTTCELIAGIMAMLKSDV